MNMFKGWRRFIGTGAICALGAGGLFLSRPAQAQAPVQNVRDEKRMIFTNKNSFRMPVKIDDGTRAQLKEVRLYVKSGAAEWVQQETAPPTVQFFNYRVQRDGEYWFSVATVDRSGKMLPADIGAEPPGLKVVVDTQPPELDLQTFTTAEGEMCVLCDLRDEHPDPQSIKITYHGANNVEKALEPQGSKMGVFRVPSPEVWGAMVRVTARDRCGNQVQRDMKMPVVQMAPASVAADSHTANAHPAPQTGPSFSAQASRDPAMETTQSVVASQSSFGPQASPGPALPRTPEPVTKLPTFQGTPGSEFQPVKSNVPTTTHAPTGRQLLNTTHASLDYRIEKAGPSGIGKVDIWMSPDSGKSWQRLCEDTDRRSPAELDLPGEGVFGLRLVVTNGNGFGGAPPSEGDQPTAWIEVDTTPPSVQLREVDPVTDGGTLTIRWTATDKNMGTNPIALYYRTSVGSAWELMAKDLQNTGSYRWSFPHNRGSQFFIGIEVTDAAGNVMRAELPNAVTLDMTEPRATVVGVSGISARPR